MQAMVQLIEADLTAEGIAMNSQETRGSRLIPVRTIEHAFDKFLLEFIYSFFKQNASLDHLTH